MKIEATHENGNMVGVTGDARTINLMGESGFVSIEITDSVPDWQQRDDEADEIAVQEIEQKIHEMTNVSTAAINGVQVIKINRHEVVIWGCIVSIESAAEAIA